MIERFGRRDLCQRRGEISTPTWPGNGDDILDGRGGHAVNVHGGKDNDTLIGGAAADTSSS